MSLANKKLEPFSAVAFNTAIAILEGKNRLARQFLRDASNPKDFPLLYIRLLRSVEKLQEKAISTAAIEILRESLTLVPGNDDDASSFFSGVQAFEQLVERKYVLNVLDDTTA